MIRNIFTRPGKGDVKVPFYLQAAVSIYFYPLH